MRKSLIAIAITAMCACSPSNDGGPSVDARAPDAASDSICGKPGDVGNEMGVGRYCTALDQCSGAAASICAVLGDPRAHFCTKTCMAGQGAEACGSGATCQCQGGLCGCVPSSCLQASGRSGPDT